MPRALAALFAASWLVLPGFGLIDLSVTWSDDWPVVLEAGWGLFFTVLVGAAFVGLAAWPHRAAAPLAQLWVSSAALAVAAVASLEGGTLVLAAAVAIETAPFARFSGFERLRPLELAPDPALVLLALAGAGPWLAYAVHMSELNRQGLADADVTNGIDHYSVQAALALAVVGLSALAAVWPRGRRFVGVSVGIAALYLGVVSFSEPGADGGFGRGWSALAVAWGAVVATTAARRVLPPPRRALP